MASSSPPESMPRTDSESSLYHPEASASSACPAVAPGWSTDSESSYVIVEPPHVYSSRHHLAPVAVPVQAMMMPILRPPAINAPMPQDLGGLGSATEPQRSVLRTATGKRLGKKERQAAKHAPPTSVLPPEDLSVHHVTSVQPPHHVSNHQETNIQAPQDLSALPLTNDQPPQDLSTREVNSVQSLMDLSSHQMVQTMYEGRHIDRVLDQRDEAIRRSERMFYQMAFLILLVSVSVGALLKFFPHIFNQHLHYELELCRLDLHRCRDNNFYDNERMLALDRNAAMNNDELKKTVAETRKEVELQTAADIIDELQIDIATKNAQLHEATGNIIALQKGDAKKDAQLKEAAGDIGVLRKDNAKKDAKLKEAAGDIQALQKGIAKKDAELTEAVGDIKALQRDNVKKDAKLKEAAGDIGVLQKDTAKKDAKLKEAAGDVKALQKDIKTKDAKLKEAVGNIKALQKINAKKNAKLKEATGKIVALQKGNAKKNSKLKSAARDNRALRKDIVKSEKAVRRLLANNDGLVFANDKRRAAFERVQIELAARANDADVQAKLRRIAERQNIRTLFHGLHWMWQAENTAKNSKSMVRKLHALVDELRSENMLLKQDAKRLKEELAKLGSDYSSMFSNPALSLLASIFTAQLRGGRKTSL